MAGFGLKKIKKRLKYAMICIFSSQPDVRILIMGCCDLLHIIAYILFGKGIAIPIGDCGERQYLHPLVRTLSEDWVPDFFYTFLSPTQMLRSHRILRKFHQLSGPKSATSKKINTVLLVPDLSSVFLLCDSFQCIVFIMLT